MLAITLQSLDILQATQELACYTKIGKYNLFFQRVSQ